MITFLFTNSLLFLKLFILILIKLFLMPNIFAKQVLLFLLIFCLYLCFKFPRKRFKTLSKVRNYKLNRLMKYALKTPLDHIYNCFIILCFFVVSIVLLIFLRFYNKDKVIDISEKYYLLSNLIFNTSNIEIVLNISIFIIFLCFYFIFLIKLTTYFKFHLIKRHLYMTGGVFEIPDVDNWYALKFIHFLYTINIYHIHFELMQKLENIYIEYFYKNKVLPDNYDSMSEEERKHYDLQKPVSPYYFFYRSKKPKIIFHIMTKWHYLLLFICLLYDLFYNNYKITLIFSILPWTLFFDLYLKLSKFIHDLWLPHDEYIHTILYGKNIEIWDKDTLLIDGHFYDYQQFKIIYRTYIKNNFVKDPNNL